MPSHKVVSDSDSDMLSPVRLSVCLSSLVCNARAPYSGVESFGNFSKAFGTLAILWYPQKILRRSSQRNSSAGWVKHKYTNTAILDLSKAISRKRCKIGGMLLLITNRKSHMSFRLVWKSVTLNDLEQRDGRYFPLFQRIRQECSPEFLVFRCISYDDMMYGTASWGTLNARGVAKYRDFGLIGGNCRKGCKIGGKLVLISNRKSYMRFRLVPKSVTLNDLERRNGAYFALFH